MDSFSQEKRSHIMGLIKAKDTKPEKLVRSFLHRQGLRFKLHCKLLPGKPDLVFTKYKTVVFVHGCFWHGHADPSCKRSNIPKSNIEYWVNKIEKNKIRDKCHNEQLIKLGWRVLIIWECQIKKNQFLLNLLNEIKNIQGNN
ncbi:very short patch repair endonuclease [Legionella tucsonensis]|uniref:Very short patch repair endonuclease n=1 Tax=Legionella tucsonensis TaxID=40335 RepID=A0A0W0ZXC6_9GAMM|nr:very short patch repair endonuclease [Legionella tucsonensis]KTD73788.1 patch repair protein [Legionella tucsonensis]